MEKKNKILRKLLNILRYNWYYKFDVNKILDILAFTIKTIDKYSDIYYMNPIEKKKSVPSNNIETLKLLDNKIAIIKISSFGDEQCSDWEKILEKFNNEYCCLVLDLCNCQGGSLESALSLCNTILQKNTIQLAFKRKNQLIDVGDNNNRKIVYCLVSENTLSSAELVAGLIKESPYGSVIGENRTYGKNTIQKKFYICNIVLKITIGKFIFKQVGDIENIGILPDVIMERYLDNTFERLNLERPINIGENKTNIYVLQKILNAISDKKIKITGKCDESTIKLTEEILGRKIGNKIMPRDLEIIYYKYMLYCSRIENDKQIIYVMKEVSENEKKVLYEY
ncbi:S41 family peptidase [Paramaledivibacter caminithermalis]|uniref:Peptidase family S41 n=1 Tax=Paramaledivibacter caminithermalis (strain DSM 15212 / CIP 107654 / DViRD3) TaxID=1121301 RepID=A0A1M6TFH6_PARC5|nr:S41 family peptidase [Paramaledivibacter caminithermalis]SHK55747.1 Peptidase family S41 [Paramaledivibacter caminithermalis DSM 15212]